MRLRFELDVLLRALRINADLADQMLNFYRNAKDWRSTYKRAFITPLVDIIWGGEYLRSQVREYRNEKGLSAYRCT